MKPSQNPSDIKTDETYSSVIDYLQEVSQKSAHEVMNLREQWLTECLLKAGLDVQLLYDTIKVVTADETNQEYVEKLITKSIQNYYDMHKIQLMIHGDKEFLLKDDVPIGMWSGNVGIHVEGEKLMLSVKQWMKYKNE